MPNTTHDKNLLTRVLYLCIGILSLIAGLIGIVLPLLPTTPFILLSAWCFTRSSRSFHTWLVTHPRLGKVISDWEKYKGMTAANKRRAYVLIAFSFAISIYIAPLWWIKLILVPIGCGVVWHIHRMNIVPD